MILLISMANRFKTFPFPHRKTLHQMTKYLAAQKIGVYSPNQGVLHKHYQGSTNFKVVEPKLTINAGGILKNMKTCPCHYIEEEEEEEETQMRWLSTLFIHLASPEGLL